MDYVNEVLNALPGGDKKNILDIGCGAGFISNPSRRAGIPFKGVDLSESSLKLPDHERPPAPSVLRKAKRLRALASRLKVMTSY